MIEQPDNKAASPSLENTINLGDSQGKLGFIASTDSEVYRTLYTCNAVLLLTLSVVQESA